MKAILLVQSLVLVSFATLVQAQEPSSAEMLESWGKEFVGSWVSESKLDAALPGIGEKGDTLVGEVTYTEADGLFHATWKGSVNDKLMDSAIGIVGWDPAIKKIRLQWYTRGGIKASSVYTKRRSSWSERWEATLPDGTRSFARGALTISDGKHVWENTKRTQGDEMLPDRTVAWTKK